MSTYRLPIAIDERHEVSDSDAMESGSSRAARPLSRSLRVGIALGCLWLLGLSAVTTACSDSTSQTTSAKGGSKGKGGGTAKGGANDGGADAAGNGGSAYDAAGAASVAAAGAAASIAGQPGMVPACVTPAKWVGKVAKPMPLVSVGKSVFTNSDDVANKALLVDGKYKIGNGMAFKPMNATTPIWAAVNVGLGFTKLLLTWRDYGSQDYGPSLYSGTDYKSATSPSAYVIKTSADSTDGNNGTWVVAATVTGNAVRSRSHVIEFSAMSWLRFEVTASPEVAAGIMRVVRLDELELHDMSAIGPDDYPDSWFLMGDSITKMGLDRSRGTGEIDKLISDQHPTYAPALVTAGNGGEKLPDAIRHLKSEDWLKCSEGLKFVTLAYGTNDSWGSPTPASTNFEANLREVITALLDDHRVPVLARIPWNTVASRLTEFNAVIDRLQAEFELPCGPDLYTWFQNHPDELGSDHVHPTTNATGPNGATSINRLYAEAIAPLYPTP